MEIIGISAITLGAGIAGGIFLGAKWLAPKTDTKWDDKAVDIIEGAANMLGVSPDDLAERSTGKLKEEVVKKVKDKL